MMIVLDGSLRRVLSRWRPLKVRVESVVVDVLFTMTRVGSVLMSLVVTRTGETLFSRVPRERVRVSRLTEAVRVVLRLEAVPKTSNEVPDLFTVVRLVTRCGFVLATDTVERGEIFRTVFETVRRGAFAVFEGETFSITRPRVVCFATEVLVRADVDGTVTVRDLEDVFDLAFLAEDAEEVRAETVARFERLLFILAVLTTSTVRFTRRAGIALLLDCGGV